MRRAAKYGVAPAGRTVASVGRKRAVQAVRELAGLGRSSTLDLFSLDPCGDAHALAELAAVLVQKLALATGRDPQLILDDIERDAARWSRPARH
jgi:hypothetical protein